MGSGELPTSYCSHPLSLIDQDYRARKRQRLQKRLSEQMRSAWQQGAASAGLALGTGSDLMQIINSFTGSLPPFLPSSPAPLLPSLSSPPSLPPFLPSLLSVIILVVQPLSSRSAEKSSGHISTGSRFQHAEKLQFGKVGGTIHRRGGGVSHRTATLELVYCKSPLPV